MSTRHLPCAVLLLTGLVLLPGAGCRPAPGRSAPVDSVAAATPPAGLGYVPPAPGTYDLPAIQDAADGAVLDTAGHPGRLHDHMGDRYVVLSFVYTQCFNPEGCPLARLTFHRLHRRLQDDPVLAGRVRLVTLSFDPQRDTPEAMLRYASEGGRDATAEMDDWTFLTTGSADELAPILDAYGQFVVAERDAEGRPTGVLSHALKVFLIDRELRVRNVYSSDFLHPEVLANDLHTLLLDDGEAS